MINRALRAIARTSETAVSTVGLRTDARAQAATLGDTEHRPWPLPERQWLQGQTWRDLLFAHWPVEVEALRPAVPAHIALDTFDGSAWIGVTPFEISGLRAHGTFPVPRVSRFPEVNVRTYVTIDGRPGIWFLSLDAGSRAAVAAARRVYRLPYHHARAQIQRKAPEIVFRSERYGDEARLAVRYVPGDSMITATPGTLEYFLTERYCLYTVDDELGLLRADIHHPPWPLQLAAAEILENTMTAPYGIELPGEPPLLHYSARQDVVIWSLEPA